ncbi:hypothetical protein K1T71_000415 [Dendrolimus kikuchii]|uniref:Uncharacterized protein n=1 Tax=Dendrolimus kikuchii TaxID=765133 RepID=A0ACC1DJA4_9NEOP|nr:hypothetical protein K1T71_000415 [Dendrolimus kikuchii]
MHKNMSTGNMKLLPSLLCVLFVLHCSYAPPVSPDKSKEKDSEIKEDLDEYMEYHRYLKEVVQALESDPDFRERLEKADEDDVRSGKIAEHLDFVNHNVRTKLDELKRRELDRLRHLATKQYELTNHLDAEGKVPSSEHLDHTNPHTFEIEDLKKLIKKTTEDLQAADERRKQEFKEYEMQKEFEKHQKLDAMDDTQKKEFEETLKKEEEAKKHHQPLHHPGSKQQLEEVWEKQDHMDQHFDPKAFFMMHDVDGNGVWDADEVKALFVKELDKLYGPGGPNKDMHERAEEMERMREHVFKENDMNRDGLIDFQEFMQETQRSDFNKDEGWKPIEENQIYTQAEYENFQKRRLEEVRYLQQRGLVDGHGRPIPGAEHQIHQALQQYQAYREQQANYHQQEAYHQAQQQAYQQQYQQPPQYQQAAPPQGQPQYQQPPVGQIPPQGQPQYQQPPVGQIPPQGQPQYQQPPVGQIPPQGQPQYQQAQGSPPQGQPQYQQTQYQQAQAPPPQQPQINLNQPPAQNQIPNQQPIPQGQPQQVQGQPQVNQGQVPPQAASQVQTQNQISPVNNKNN